VALEFKLCYSGMKERTISSLILTSFRGNFSIRLRRVEKLKPLKDGPLLHLCKTREKVVSYKGLKMMQVRAAEAAQMMSSCIVDEWKWG